MLNIGKFVFRVELLTLKIALIINLYPIPVNKYRYKKGNLKIRSRKSNKDRQYNDQRKGYETTDKTMTKGKGTKRETIQ
jgi:hypothetical protein